MPEVEDFSVNERGDESHPAFGLIGASRVSSAGGLHNGTVLFDSDIVHNHTVMVRIKAATRKRDLNHDWIHGGREYIEIEMSEAQWASLVSSMNCGDGVPCTVRHVDHVSTPDLPYAPRLAQSIQETSTAAHKAFDTIRSAMTAYERALAMRPKVGAVELREHLAKLHSSIENAVSNVDYAGKTLVEHTENVVTKARADIEAFVTIKARQLGVDVTELTGYDALSLGRDNYDND